MEIDLLKNFISNTKTRRKIYYGFLLAGLGGSVHIIRDTLSSIYDLNVIGEFNMASILGILGLYSAYVIMKKKV